MKCAVGIDLGSTTTKAILLDEEGQPVGRGITNSRSNYEVACAVARQEAVIDARFSLLKRSLAQLPGSEQVETPLQEAFRLEIYLQELAALRSDILANLATSSPGLEAPAIKILDAMQTRAPARFEGTGSRSSDFFRDLAAADFTREAEELARQGDAPFEWLLALFDRAILRVETQLRHSPFRDMLQRALERVAGALRPGRKTLTFWQQAMDTAAQTPIEAVAFVGTGYGRQTLPFPKAAIRSEILCHGRGAHRLFPDTRTVLDIGGQDTKAIQVDPQGVVTGFQMNDRCAAGCGRYLGYIADELNLGLHELGPLALKAKRAIRVNSTCTVFAGAELRERLALGQPREDILAGLHRAILLRALSLLARSGGIFNAFTFTGGVCKNPMATKLLAQLVQEHYGDGITLHTHPDSIYMGALGAALFALDDLKAGHPALLPDFAPKPQKGQEMSTDCRNCDMAGCSRHVDR